MVPLRLAGVAGHGGRRNDVLYLPPAAPPATTGLLHSLLFFPGDIQDYEETMRSEKSLREFVRWSLERTARRLARDFPHMHILVIRPSRIESHCFSCYDNFVPSDKTGVPHHCPTHAALAHLERLLMSVSARVRETPRDCLLRTLDARAAAVSTDAVATTSGEDGLNDRLSESASGPPSEDASPSASTSPHSPSRVVAAAAAVGGGGEGLERSRLTLVGFSKGCVVLNQLVYELHRAANVLPKDADTDRFVSQLESVYWVDGGHGGHTDTWLTDRALLQPLVDKEVNIYNHVSPYQVRDATRPWIGRDESAFTAALAANSAAKVSRYLHSGDEGECSLRTHFEVLRNFKRVQETRVGQERGAGGGPLPDIA